MHKQRLLKLLDEISMLLAAFSAISWSSMSSTLATSDVEGRFSSDLFSILACRAINLSSTGMLKPKSQSSQGCTLAFLIQFSIYVLEIIKWNASGI